MSGITPILDTLLHQVLGKRVDTAPAPTLTEPVRPAAPGEAVSALRSDSRLHPRAPLPEAAGPGAPGLLRGEKVAAGTSRARPGGAPVETASSGAGSVRTHFSAAARAIADLLLRYPAPPSAIRPPAPLLPSAEAAQPEQLARELRTSVDRSGLFYEPHLERWYRGALGSEMLSREPQMRLTRVPPRAPEPAAPAGRGASPLSDAPSDSGRIPAAGLPKGSGQTAPSPPAGTAPVEGATETAPRLRVPRDGAAGETLRGLLRHQLEMLAAPVLRWEGEVWPGLAMALTFQPPELVSQREGGEAADGRRERQQENSWRSHLTLRLLGGGEIQVRLGLHGERLDLVLASTSEGLAARLDGAAARLRERLSALGFEEVILKVEA